MRKFLVLLTIMGMFTVIGCSKNPKEHCTQAIDHTMKMVLNMDHMKKMSKEKVSEWKKDFAKNKGKSIESCVKRYDKAFTECAIKAKSMKDLDECKKEKKKRRKAMKKAIKKQLGK